MLNKPINPTPVNVCVNQDEDVHIKYEIPNGKIDECVTVINELDSGNEVLVHRERFDSCVNKVDIPLDLFNATLVESHNMSMTKKSHHNTIYYYEDIMFCDTELKLCSGDILDVQIDYETSEGEPILSKCSIPLKLSSSSKLLFGDISINGWIISGNGMPSGFLVKTEGDFDRSGATLNVRLKKNNKKEYFWESMYWLAPNVEPEKTYTICGKSSDGSELWLQGTCKLGSTYTYKQSKHSLKLERCREYSDVLYKESGYDSTTDTSEYCESGQLPNYYNYPGFYVNASTYSYENLATVISHFKMGKLVCEIYDNDNILCFRGRVVAYDPYRKGTVFLIFDKDFFDGSGINETRLEQNTDDTLTYKPNSLLLFELGDTPSEMPNGLARYSDRYTTINNATYNKHVYVLPKPIWEELSNDICGQTISFWSNNTANFNTSPSHYFRVKTPPSCSVITDDPDIVTVTDSDGEKNILRDVKAEFKVRHDSNNCDLNYFNLELYKLNSSLKWNLVEKSPMIYNAENSYEFKNLTNGTYKIKGICVDLDGDAWETPYFNFDVDIPIIKELVDYSFNKNKTTIDIDFKKTLSFYKTARIEIYKFKSDEETDEQVLCYSGGGLAKSDDIIFFNKFSDFNIENECQYSYYARIEYVGKDSEEDTGVDHILIANNVKTSFEGTSILGMDKVDNDRFAIVNRFNILYSIDNKEMGEIKNEIKRDYINSFSKYPKELRGYQNYKSGTCSGLLGGLGTNGEYEESRILRSNWIDFINDNTVKLYRGIDGETMIISIDSSSVKPRYFANNGLVNEVNFSYKEIASANSYAIYTTEKTGE